MEEKGQQREEEKEKKKGAVPKKPLKDVIKEKRLATKRGSAGGSKDDKGKMDSLVLDPYKNTNDFKDKFRKPTCYGYVQSKEHMSPWDAQHPENPKRCVAIHESLHSLLQRMHTIEAEQLINIDDYTLFGYAHSKGYIKSIQDMCSRGDPEDAQMFDSIFYNSELTFYCALQATKMVVSMAKLIVEGQYQNGFANIRPPGHHADLQFPNGYCLFNNVAIAANYLLKNNLAEKVLIVDFDVHHGQGTQEIFYKSNKVLYFSIHRYEHGTYWPNLIESNYDHIGEGEGMGFNINVPLNETGINDYDYIAIIINVLMPIAYEFHPSIILFSGGYDACIGDPEGKMNVTPAFYGHLVQLLSGVAEGKMLVVLEGGYFLPSLAEAALRTVRGLLNDPCNKMEYTIHINPSVRDSISDVKNALRPYWKCFHQFDHLIPVGDIYRYDKYNLNVAFKQYMGVPEQPPYPLKGHYPVNTVKQEQMYLAQLEYIMEDRYNMSQTRVGYIWNHESISHTPPTHQRCQEVHMRIMDIMSKLKDFKLIDKMLQVDFEISREDPGHPTIWDAVWEFIVATHSSSYICELGTRNDGKRADLYWTRNSKETITWSIAILCQLGIKISRGIIRHGIGIIRPPGHHAKYSDGSGFCLVNNVVIAANYLIKKRGFKRVLIIDFDVHHGDGTQELTYQRNDIMYISMHRFDDGKFFPKDKCGNYTYVGEEAGAGYNLNIPFNKEKMDNVDYLQTWIKIVLPVSYAYNPDIILVSAGFDAAINDPLGNYNIFPEVYGHFIQMLKPIGPIIIALEGGYNHESTSLGMVNCARALLGHPIPMPPIGDAKDTTLKTIMNVITVAKPYWPILEVNKWVDTKSQKKRDESSDELLKIRGIAIHN